MALLKLAIDRATRIVLTACVLSLAAITSPANADDTLERTGGVILANLVIKNFSCAKVASAEGRAKYSEEYVTRAEAISNKVLAKMDYMSKSPQVSDQFKAAFMYGAKKMSEDLDKANTIEIDGVKAKFDCGNPAHLAEFENIYIQLEQAGTSASE
jgi:hypothetical protein